MRIELRYKAAGTSFQLPQTPSRLQPEPSSAGLRCPPALQIKDLNSGTFGFVQLALDRTTGRNVAIKFIERGDKVGSLANAVTPGCEIEGR